MKFLQMRAALNVRRYHQIPTHEIDTVGKHSAGVALFCMIIDPGCSRNVLAHALVHDLGEIVTGDIPSPAKKAMPIGVRVAIKAMENKAIEEMGFNLPELTDSEARLIKVADMLDGLSFCFEEVMRGNRNINPVGFNFEEYLKTYLSICIFDPWYPNAVNLNTHISRNWNNAQRQ